MSDNTYNGWTNYETWDVALWLGNEEGLYNQARELGERVYGNWANDDPLYSYSGALADMVGELNPIGSDASMFSDMLNAALSCVNWREIAEHYVDDFELEARREEEEIEEEEERTPWELHASAAIFGDAAQLFEIIRLEGGMQGKYLDMSDFDYFWRNDTNIYSRE